MPDDERDIYREEILEQYRNPRNFGTLKKPSHSASAFNALCGDSTTLHLRVDAKDIVEDVAFEGSGCALSIASASLFTEWMKGKNIKLVQKTGELQIQKLIKAPITPARLHCVLLPYAALQKALARGE